MWEALVWPFPRALLCSGQLGSVPIPVTPCSPRLGGLGVVCWACSILHNTWQRGVWSGCMHMCACVCMYALKTRVCVLNQAVITRTIKSRFIYYASDLQFNSRAPRGWCPAPRTMWLCKTLHENIFVAHKIAEKSCKKKLKIQFPRGKNLCLILLVVLLLIAWFKLMIFGAWQ